MPSPPSLPRDADAAAAALLLVATLLAYATAFGASFQLDDWDVIVRDPRVQGFEAWWASMPGIRPLLKLSYAANHASGLGVVGFHAVNVAIHAVNAQLVLALVRRLAARHRPDTGSPRWIALAAALVFALHPVQTEAVTYASGRSSSLSTGFALASLLIWARHREPTRATRLRDLALSLLAMLAALATKESAVYVPALVLLWAATEPDAGSQTEQGLGSDAGLRLRGALRASALHWLVLLGGIAAALSLPAYRSLAATSLATRRPLENLVAQLHAIAWLLGQLVRPDRLNADPALVPVTRLDAAGAGIAAALLVALLVAVAGLRRAPLASFAVLWTLIAWLPTNSLVARLDLANDRQWYAALIGPALAFGVGVGAIATDRAGRPHAARLRRGTATLLVCSLALGLGLATHRRNAVYRDELVFWLDVARKSPWNTRAFNNLGLALAEGCELDAAAAAWRRALELDPELARAGVNLRLLHEGAAWVEACVRADGGNDAREGSKRGGGG